MYNNMEELVRRYYDDLGLGLPYPLEMSSLRLCVCRLICVRALYPYDILANARRSS